MAKVSRKKRGARWARLENEILNEMKEMDMNELNGYELTTMNEIKMNN